MLLDLLIHATMPRDKAAWLNHRRLETKLVKRWKRIDNVILKWLILQLNRKERRKQDLLLLLQHLKVSLHHHFVDGSVPTATTSILA
jgi:hypothetical protein